MFRLIRHHHVLRLLAKIAALYFNFLSLFMSDVGCHFVLAGIIKLIRLISNWLKLLIVYLLFAPSCSVSASACVVCTFFWLLPLQHCQFGVGVYIWCSCCVCLLSLWISRALLADLVFSLFVYSSSRKEHTRDKQLATLTYFK
jgi:hypothetical protein